MFRVTIAETSCRSSIQIIIGLFRKNVIDISLSFIYNFEQLFTVTEFSSDFSFC